MLAHARTSDFASRAADAALGAWKGVKTLPGDLTAAEGAAPVGALGEPLDGRVDAGQPKARISQERHDLLALERDRVALRVVLVIGGDQLRRVDELPELRLERSDLGSQRRLLGQHPSGRLVIA